MGVTNTRQCLDQGCTYQSSAKSPCWTITAKPCDISFNQLTDRPTLQRARLLVELRVQHVQYIILPELNGEACVVISWRFEESASPTAAVHSAARHFTVSMAETTNWCDVNDWTLEELRDMLINSESPLSIKTKQPRFKPQFNKISKLKSRWMSVHIYHWNILI